jgi:hypothetical protein
MKIYLKIAIIAASLLILVLVANLVLQWYIGSKLPQFLNENPNSPDEITFKKISVSLAGNATASQVVVMPKKALEDSLRPGIFAKIKEVEIRGFKIWTLLREDRIEAAAVRVHQPDVTIFAQTGQSKNSARIKNEVSKPLSKLIYVSDVLVYNGKIKFLSRQKQRVMHADSINIALEGIAITSETQDQVIPFTFRNYSIEAANAYYRINGLYKLYAGKVDVSKQGFAINGVKLQPTLSRSAFIKSIKKEKDHFTIGVQNLSGSGIDWGFNGEEFYAHARSLTLNRLSALIYRPKMVADDPSYKKMYSQLLREIPVDLKVDTLKMRNSRIVYEEEKDKSHGAGKVSFGNFYMTATGVASTKGKAKVEPVQINVNCRFMDTAPMKTYWTFNALDKADSFRIKGSIKDFPAERMSVFTKPYLNAEVKGNIEEVYFDFTGNKSMAKGEFAINYENLKVDVYRKKDRKKKNKVVSALANLFIKKDTKDKVKNASVQVDRLQDRSFFNLLWRAAADGLKQILI